MKRLLGVLAIVSAFAISPVYAQSSADFGLATVTSTCLSESAPDSACEDAVQAYINAVLASGLSPQQKDDVLADLVVALGSSGPTMSQPLRARVAAVILTIADAFSDPTRAQNVREAAADLEVTGVTADRISASAA
jgi:hypothetical protein